MPVLADKTNQRFGKLTCLSYQGKGMWLCRCDCGKQTIVRSDCLNTGNTRSCGCLSGELHGMTKTPEYRTWHHMNERCSNPNNRTYKNYGGRGIFVCEQWRNSFTTFYKDMGPRPSSKHSIDRINNNGNYEPGNCRWATIKEQNGNTRYNHVITFNNQTMIVTDWAKQLGIGCAALISRINRNGVEIALSAPFPIPRGKSIVKRKSPKRRTSSK